LSEDNRQLALVVESDERESLGEAVVFCLFFFRRRAAVFAHHGSVIFSAWLKLHVPSSGAARQARAATKMVEQGNGRISARFRPVARGSGLWPLWALVAGAGLVGRGCEMPLRAIRLRLSSIARDARKKLISRLQNRTIL